MSLAINPVESVLAQDPRIDARGASSNAKYVIEKGAQLVSIRRIPSNNFSNSNISFNAPPPSERVFVDRKIKITVPLRLTFTGTSVGSTLLQIGSNDAPRFHPLHNALFQSIQVNINNSQASMTPSDYYDALMRYNNYKQGMNDFSTSPSMQDQDQLYSNLLGANRSPLGSYADGLDKAFTPRGEFADVVVVSDDGTTAVVDCLFSEYIFVSPLTFGLGDETGLIGLNKFDLTVNMNNGNELRRVWSHDAVNGENITDLQVQVGGANSFPVQYPELHFTYLTPRPTQVIPNKMSYSYYNINSYAKDIGVVAGGLTSTGLVPSNNIQLNSIPKRVYVFARQRNAVRDFTDCDAYLSINNLSVNWDNLNSQLSNASSVDLFEISRRNGLEMSYTQWRSKIGSVMCIDFAHDIGLREDQAPGLLGNYQLQISVDFKNLNPNPVDATFYVVAILEGQFNITDGNTSTQLGVVDPASVLLDPDQLSLADYEMYKADRTFYGGSVFQNIKDWGKKALKYGKKALPYAIRGAELVAPEAIPVLEGIRHLVGQGYSEAEARQIMSGSGLVGGRAVGKSKLKKRLR